MSSDHYELAACGNGSSGVPVELIILSDNPAVLRVKIGSNKARDFTGVDLFDCLLSVRAELESKNLLLCCQGARSNVTPSGMTRQMSNGRLAYLLPPEGPISDEDLVDIFAPADCAEVVSVADQKVAISRVFRGS
ncbi:hypothetical protein GCM10010201_21800 [Pilimelia columellifera subsp. columellifera]|uniref:Uncharacterized protein n=1 Tax=Pilimelia columellifera subsp. columellifera TaxID=706583 RepID=A0ABN3NIA2_9ACTN